MKAKARTQVMDAVQQLGWRVTLGDVAASTGLALPDARQELLTLAQDADGHLEVADTGDIAYVFGRDFRSTLQRKAAQNRWLAFRRKVWQGFLRGLRLSFGILLIVSIALITLALIALMMASQSNDNNNRNRGRGGGGLGFIYFPRLWIGNPFWSPYPRRRYRARSSREARSPGYGKGSGEEEMGFLDSVYSFLFGDGDPNEDLEEKRYQHIANLIRKQGGVITAEQVLPYLDVAQPDSREDHMLPILTKFDGRPEVSDSGDLIYRFPELQISADKASRSLSIPPTLEENLWTFSEAPPGQLTLAGGLGVLNVGLAAILFALRDQVALGAAQGSAILGLVNPLVGLLFLYGLSFLTVPAIRWMALQRRNQAIQERTKTRRQWASQLQDPSPALQAKLEFAQRFAGRQVVDPDRIIYSSDRDMIDQRDYELDKPEYQALLDQEGS